MPRKTYSMMTTMTDRPKSITVVLGMLSGALITAALGAFDFWIFTYTDTRDSFLHEYAVWLATILGAGMGLISGAVLGVFLSFRRRGSLFGAAAGAIGNVAIILLLALMDKYPTGDERVDLTLQLFVLVGAISGFLTSLLVSQTRSWAERKDRRPAVTENQQPRRNRTLLE
jgi:hypothetical protein